MYKTWRLRTILDKCESKNWPLLLPSLPKVVVRETSGRMHDLPLRWGGSRIQSSQYPLGHFGPSSSHRRRVMIHPNPPKKSDRYSLAGSLAKRSRPLSFQAVTVHSEGSLRRSAAPASM